MKASAILSRAVFALALMVIHDCAMADSPPFSWVRQGVSAAKEYGVAVAIDPAGNTFVGARVEGAPGNLGNLTIPNSIAGVVVARFNSSGVGQWARTIQPSENIHYISLGADDAGNCYLMGRFSGVVNVGGTNLSAGSSPLEIFLAKYDPVGNLIWLRSAGGGIATNKLSSAALSVGRNGNCLLSGHYAGKARFGTNQVGFTGAVWQPFVASCDANGNWLWLRDPCTTTNSHVIRAMCTTRDTSGNYFVGGDSFNASTVFGSHVFTNRGFLIKCNANGDVLWAKGVTRSCAIALSTDSAGNCYLLGGNTDDFFLDSTVSIEGYVVTNARMFLVKFDPAGNLLWCRNPAEQNIDTTGAQDGTWRLGMDGADQVYVSGYFSGVTTFGSLVISNRGGTLFQNPGFYYPSSFIAKYDSMGSVLWAKSFGGAKNVSKPALLVSENWPLADGLDWPSDKTAMAVNNAGVCSVVGTFSITDAPFDNATLATFGGEDVFVAQLAADPPRLSATRAGANVVTSWPTNQPGFALEHNNTLTTGGWTTVTNPVVTMGIYHFITNSSSGGSQFFRLRKP